SLTRLWKTALSGLDDVRSAPDPMAAVEMSVIRLMAAASLPGPEDAARLIAALEAGAPLPAQTSQAGESGGAPSAQADYQHDTAEPEHAASTDPTSLED